MDNTDRIFCEVIKTEKPVEITDYRKARLWCWNYGINVSDIYDLYQQGYTLKINNKEYSYYVGYGDLCFVLSFDKPTSAINVSFKDEESFKFFNKYLDTGNRVLDLFEYQTISEYILDEKIHILVKVLNSDLVEKEEQ